MKSFKIPVGLAHYTVKFRKTVKHDGVECEGMCDPVKKVLLIERREPEEKDVMVAAFWHEFAHALFFELGMAEFALNESFIESIATNLARASRALPEDFK